MANLNRIYCGLICGMRVYVDVGEMIDCFGIKRTTTDVVIQFEDGSKTYVAVAPPIKATEYSRESDIRDATVKVAREDAELLIEQNKATLVKIVTKKITGA